MSTISCLSATIPQITNIDIFPEGISYVPSILNLILPGLDSNDLIKTINTLTFLNHLFMSIPVVSSWNINCDLYDESINYDIQQLALYFEEWVPLFLDRLWLLFEYLPENTNSMTLEGNLIRFIWNTTDLLFMQLSPDLYDLTLRKLEKKVLSQIIPNATQAIGKITNFELFSLYLRLIKRKIPEEDVGYFHSVML
jgi:hypothetical protein